MPSEAGFWIVAVIAVATVAALALWLGRDVVLKFKGFSFSTDRPKQAQSSDVRVAEGTEVGGNVRRVVGRSLGAGEGAVGATEVGKGMKVGGSVDEIVGIETKPKQPPR